MRKILLFFLMIGSGYLQAQNFCGPYQISTEFAGVTIYGNADIEIDGLPISNGATLVFVDEDNNCVSDPVTWTGLDLSILINGESNGIEGYKINEELRLLVSPTDSCYQEAFQFQGFSTGNDVVYNYQAFGNYDIFGFRSESTNFSFLNSSSTGADCGDPTGSITVSVFDGTRPYTYEWSHDTMVVENTAMELDTGLYTITITDAFGCSIIATEVVETATPPIAFEFAIDTTQVLCTELVLQNALPCPGCVYEWSTGVTADAITVTDDNTYFVTITANGCETQDSIEVSFSEPLSLELTVSDFFVCMGDTILLSASGAINYDWTYADTEVLEPMEGITQAVVNGLTTFRVIGRDLCFTDSIFVTVDLWPLPSAGSTQCIAKGNFAVQLEASGAVEYLWEDNPVGPVSDATIPNPTANPTETTDYFVNFVDENGCPTRGSVTIEVIDDIVASIPLYNVITPNGDGKNDVLFFDKLETALETELIVFDRWGKVVFETEAYANDWRGTRTSGGALPGGSYYYILTVNGIPLRSKLTIVYE